jgi:phosphatidylglycerophosphatase C
MNDNKAIAFFDFDGTITNKDIFWDYIRFRIKYGLPYYKVVMCLPVLAKYFLKLIDNEKAKMQVFSILFKGENSTEFDESIKKYSLQSIASVIRVDALERINWHKTQNHVIVIVSANFEPLVKYFAAKLDIGMLCTQIQIIDNQITGKFATANCYGLEKVKRINQQYPNLIKFDEIYAYGDSKGDKEMLAVATHPYYRLFKK